MKRIDKLGEILKSYEGRKYHEEQALTTWETMKKLFGKDKLDQLGERSKGQVIELYESAEKMSAANNNSEYVLGMSESITSLLKQESYPNPHAISVWYQINKNWLDTKK